ncbi:MAG: hypothetical protein IPF83_11945 [Rhodanobacteraceae bacterium]|jgi:hypothetical protein|nr:hypothetical protein [Rhodanobacteraceae bacterium]MBK7044237.1 hypothetical protein [Rhodanobacteraceae bacterium]MBP9154256.1 hypothetical protein [Xanthomonadales bacterium]HQW80341.1 hypothetical protein [Pseudomonadota bacterium]
MRILSITISAIALCGALAACSSDTTPVDPAIQAERQDPKGNPLKGTVLESQGEAMKKARGVEDIIGQSARDRLKEADAEAQ